jgi:putative FmdB family regulatory protein
MPVFDYICQDEDCAYMFEELIPFNDEEEELPKCPKCGTESKKLPPLIARMKANWSQWNAMG